MRVPALNDDVHGLRGGCGCNPGSVGRATRKKRSNDPSSFTGVPGGSAWYAVSEKRISPARPPPRCSRFSVAAMRAYVSHEMLADVGDDDPRRAARQQRGAALALARRDEERGRGEQQRDRAHEDGDDLRAMRLRASAR